MVQIDEAIASALHPFLSSYHHHPLGKRHLGLRVPALNCETQQGTVCRLGLARKPLPPGIGKRRLGLRVPQGAQQGTAWRLLGWEGVGLCNAVPLRDTDLPISYQLQGPTYRGPLYIRRPPRAGQPLTTTTFLSFQSAVITPPSCWGSPFLGCPIFHTHFTFFGRDHLAGLGRRPASRVPVSVRHFPPPSVTLTGYVVADSLPPYACQTPFTPDTP